MKKLIRILAVLLIAAMLLPCCFAYAGSDAEEVYLILADLYRSGNYEEAYKCGFSDEADWEYKDTMSYAMLAAAHLYDNAEVCRFVLENLDFEDAKDLAVSDQFYAGNFVDEGVWREDGHNFKIDYDSQKETFYRFPTKMEYSFWGNWTSFFKDGVEYVYNSSMTEEDAVKNLKITIIDYDNIIIHSYVEDKDYEFYRAEK